MVTPSDLSFDTTGRVLPATSTVVMLATWQLTGAEQGCLKDHLRHVSVELEAKTISSVFHQHNTSATRKLSVYLDGQRLRHECHPTYLGVTLDRTLSYREHLTS